MVNTKEFSSLKKNGKEWRRVQGMKKKAEELSILCDVETCLIITDHPSSSSSLCYSWPEDLHTCISSLQRYRNFNQQKEMMITQKKRKIDCLTSTDEKFKKPKFDSSLSTDFHNGFDDDVQLLLSMIDSEQKAMKEQTMLLTESQPKEAEVVVVELSDEILNSEYHCERKDFDDSDNLVSADLCDVFDDYFTQIQLLDENQKEAHYQVEQSEEFFGCDGNNFENFKMISEKGNSVSAHFCDGFDDELQCLLSEVDPTQIQLFSDNKPEEVHDQAEILSCEEKKDSEDSEMMINELIFEYQNLNDMDYIDLMGNFEGIPETSDNSETYQTLNDSWEKLPPLSTV